ncbi:MAG: histidine kinase [Chloroflexi bacterium]|nr:MAG: histidine kinase [Chloroflexota bacterium]
MKNLPVVQAKRYGTYRCKPGDTLAAAAAQMTTRNISALIVVDDEGLLEGIITRTDLVRACYERDEWAGQPVRDYMSRQVVTVPPNAPVAQVMALLLERHIHRVVIAESAGARLRPIAVLSAADIVYHMVQDPIG